MVGPRDPEKENILFLDIETVPQYASFKELPEPLQHLWEEKMVRQKKLKEGETPEEAWVQGGLFAEFGKIVCIGVGFFEKETFQLRAFSGDDEKNILLKISQHSLSSLFSIGAGPYNYVRIMARSSIIHTLPEGC